MTTEAIPFYSDPWRGDAADAAKAIWDWHLALRDRAMDGGLNGVDIKAACESVRQGRMSDVVGAEVGSRVVRASAIFNLDAEEFAKQLEAAQRLAGAIRFADFEEQRLFFDRWICPVGRLLASLANVSGILHVGYVNALSTGFYLLEKVLEIPRDVPAGRVFIPQAELSAFSVDESQLRQGPPGQQVQKLLWKQCVRIRDYFARALPLSRDLPRRDAVGFRRWWLRGLETVAAIERRGYDVWAGPVHLSYFHRLQARYQARYSRTIRRRN